MKRNKTPSHTAFDPIANINYDDCQFACQRRNAILASWIIVLYEQRELSEQFKLSGNITKFSFVHAMQELAVYKLVISMLVVFMEYLKTIPLQFETLFDDSNHFFKMASPCFPLIFNGSSKIILTKWRVYENFAINQTPFVIFQYRNFADRDRNSEELKYKISQCGIIVKVIYKKVNEVIEPDDVLLEYEMCTHATVMKDLCAICGVNLSKFDLSEQQKIASQTSVAMVHSIPELRVSKKVAEDLGRADESRLLRSRKLVLLVDLDQTIINSSNEPIPNDIPDIHHYQLHGPNSPWYHTKFRPFMYEFLEDISRYYELHICTFGARRYAHLIANLIDPKSKYFPKDRILSRDEFFDPRSKTGNMNSLFPCGDSMVCIIDDRVDVWNFAPNVVHVKPYVYFNVGDINAVEKLSLDWKNEKNQESDNASEGNEPIKNDNLLDSTIDSKSNDKSVDNEQQLKNDEKVKDQAVVPQEFQNLVEDKDDYLLYLKDILIKIHKNYYKEYDDKIKYKSDEEEILLPDLKQIIPRVRKLILRGVNIVFSGVIATNAPPESSPYYRLAELCGATVTNDVVVNGSPKTTHLLASKWGTAKVTKCLEYPHIKMVTPDWLLSCAERWEKVEEKLYELNKNSNYNMKSKDEKNFIPYFGLKYTPQKVDLFGATSSTSQGDDEKNASKRMVDFCPLSGFSTTDLKDMGKEVEECCSDDENDSSNDDEEEENIGFENEYEFSENSDLNRTKGVKRNRSDVDDGECANRFIDDYSSSSDDDGSVDEEMAAAIEKEFLDSD